jgi:hypothetical protein
VVAAVAAAGALACRPQSGLGTIAYTRGATRHVVNLATCSDTVIGSWRPRPPRTPGVSVRSSGRGHSLEETIWANGRPIFLQPQYSKTIRDVYETPGPIILLGDSPDRHWLLFTTDPAASASLAADGLILRVVSMRGGRVHTLGLMLTTEDRMSWCGGRLVFSGGGDRVAWHNKQLLTAAPPNWRVRPLVADRGRAWGSLACSPDGRSVVAQSQRESTVANFFLGKWTLWRIWLDGREQQLTHPPRGFVDESPRFAGQTLFFVRSRRGRGVLYALRSGRVVGPFASLGYDLGFYGHHAWPYAVRR